MSIQPTDKYLMADYRNIMGTNDAPQMINTEMAITPVAVINNSLPTPNAKQVLKVINMVKAGAGDYQILTPTSDTSMYLLGFSISAGANYNITIGDATTGAMSQTDNDTTTFYTASDVTLLAGRQFNLVLPLRLIRGLRVTTVGAVAVRITFYYMEELLR